MVIPNPQEGGGKPAVTGVTRIMHALGYSVAGIKAAYQYEPAFRQLLWIAAVLITAAFFCR